MKNGRRLCKNIAVFLLIVALFDLSGCSPKKKPETPEKQSQQEEKEPPEELDKLKEGIEKVEKALKAIYDENKKPLFIQQEKLEGGEEKQGQENKSGEQSSGQQEGQGSSSSGGGSQSSAAKLTPEQIKLKLDQEKFKKFEAIKKDVMKLHSAWNSYEPKAIADFAIQSSLNDFEMALNNLTKAVELQDIYLSMLEVNQLYKFLPDFYMLYKTKVPPDLDRIRYAVKKIMLVGEKKDFTSANDTLAYLETVWMATRPKLKKDNLQMMSKFEFALSDLKNAVIAKNDMIIEAKSEVILKLTDEIEKAAEKEK